MAKTKPSKSSSKKSEKSALNRTSGGTSKISTPPPSPAQLLLKATTALEEGDIAGSVTLAKRALSLVEVDSEDALPVLNLLGEIHVELGEIDAARDYFLMAANLDSEGEISEDLGGGAEKFLWLAQLSENGGEDSVGWFERGAATLRWQIQQLLETHSKKGGAASAAASAELEAVLEEKRRKLATALCGVVEVYMTDLSWEEDAEQKCEALVTEATMVAPGFADPWQTLASVRISQIRLEDARAALQRSLELWKDLSPDDPAVPDFPTRVSLARLLMEAEMEDEAIEVLERLVGEDDGSVEVWYLGGWGLYILGEKQKEKEGGETYKISWISSRQWLNESMRLFKLVDYDDERLGEHAKELITLLDNDLGGPMKEGEDEDEDDEEDSGDWESGDEEDEEMAEA